jgi:hypothetical protein
MDEKSLIDLVEEKLERKDFDLPIINYPAASGRGIRRVTIGNLHVVYNTRFLGF